MKNASAHLIDVCVGEDPFRLRPRDHSQCVVEAEARANIPDLSTGNAEKFVLFLGFFVPGAWPSADPAPAVLEAFERSDFEERKLDLPDALRTHSRVVLSDLLAEGER